MQRKDDGQIFFKSQTDSVIQWFQMTLRLWETTFNDLLIDFHYEFDFDRGKISRIRARQTCSSEPMSEV